MGRIIAIDYGSKRVGLAVTDPLQIIASPLDTVHSKDVIQFLKNYDQSEGIESFVLGMPKPLWEGYKCYPTGKAISQPFEKAVSRKSRLFA